MSDLPPYPGGVGEFSWPDSCRSSLMVNVVQKADESAHLQVNDVDKEPHG